MSDERALLERVGDRFEFPDDAFDRLLRRRNRKIRNQRIASGLVAMIVSLLAIAGLLRALGTRETGDRTILPEPRPPGALDYRDNGLSVIATGHDLGYSWTLSDQHVDPRTDPGPYLVIEGPMAIPILIEPVDIWQIGCLEHGAYLAAATLPAVDRVMVRLGAGTEFDARWMPIQDRRGRPLRLWLAFLPPSGRGVVRIGDGVEVPTRWPVEPETTGRMEARIMCASVRPS
jgi:hypothetical protein